MSGSEQSGACSPAQNTLSWQLHAGTLGIWQGHLGFKPCTPGEAAGLEDRIVMPEDEVHLLKLATGQPLPFALPPLK